jgi:hypothetical protein
MKEAAAADELQIAPRKPTLPTCVIARHDVNPTELFKLGAKEQSAPKIGTLFCCWLWVFCSFVAFVVLYSTASLREEI